MATATLIQSNQQPANNSGHPLSFNFNDVSTKQKIHYTARPYIIDNQVQSSNLYEILYFMDFYITKRAPNELFVQFTKEFRNICAT